METRDVDFIEDGTFILIILGDTGVTYHQQAGGVSCLHKEAEGLAVKIDDLAVELDLGFLSDASSTSGWEEDVNKAFADAGLPFTLNPDKVDDSCEAWLHVLIGDGTSEAILTWENSD